MLRCRGLNTQHSEECLSFLLTLPHPRQTYIPLLVVRLSLIPVFIYSELLTEQAVCVRCCAKYWEAAEENKLCALPADGLGALPSKRAVPVQCQCEEAGSVGHKGPASRCRVTEDCVAFLMWLERKIPVAWSL